MSEIDILVVDFPGEDEVADHELVTVAAAGAGVAQTVSASQRPKVFWKETLSAAKSTPAMLVTSRAAIQSQRPAVDLEKVKVGTTLRHKAFGLGVATKLERGYLFVDFNGNEKKFLFPATVLEGYLSLK